MPVAEILTAVTLGVKTVMFLVELKPIKVMHRADKLQQETAALYNEEVFQRHLKPEQRAELEDSQARIDRAREALPSTGLTVKEILKNPKLVRKAIKHKDLCKQMFNRVQTISSHAKIADASEKTSQARGTSEAGSVRVQFRKELKEGVKELELCVNLPGDGRPITLQFRLQEEIEQSSDATSLDTAKMTLDVSGVLEIKPDAAQPKERDTKKTISVRIHSLQITDKTSNRTIVKEKCTGTVHLG